MRRKMGKKKGKKKEKKKLVQDDDDEPPPPAAPEPVFEPEPPVPPGEVDFGSIARRLNGGDISAATDAAALEDVVAACNDVRGIDTRDDDAVSKVQEHGIVDAVFRLLQGKPKPKPEKKKKMKRATGNDDDDGEGYEQDEEEEEGEEEEEELTPEEAKAREELNAAHERFDTVVLPATRAVAHLCGAPGPLRRYVADAIIYLRSLWALLEPLSSPSTHEAALRSLTSTAQGSTSAASTLAGFVGGRDATLPKGGEWFVALLHSPAERVGGKCIRLALALTKTTTNRVKVFGDAARDDGAVAGAAADVLGAAFELATNSSSDGVRCMCLRLVHAAVLDVGEPLVRVLDEADCNGPDALMELLLRDESPAVQMEAARVLLTLLPKDRSALLELGERAAVKAMRPLLPSRLSAPPPEIPVVAEKSVAEGGEFGREGGADDADAQSVDSDVSVGGHNILTEAFGVDPLDRLSPPPPREPTPPPPDPFEPASPESANDPAGAPSSTERRRMLSPNRFAAASAGPS